MANFVEKFDVVKLKSTERLMLVISIDGTNVDRSWQEDGKRVVGEFHIDSLEVVTVDIPKRYQHQ